MEFRLSLGSGELPSCQWFLPPWLLSTFSKTARINFSFFPTKIFPILQLFFTPTFCFGNFENTLLVTEWKEIILEFRSRAELDTKSGSYHILTAWPQHTRRSTIHVESVSLVWGVGGAWVADSWFRFKS